MHDATEPCISPLDRGFLYGDAVYEVWRTYHGVLFAFREHWARLLRSAEALHLPLPFSEDELFEQLRATAARFRSVTGWGGDLYLRLQLTRGGGPIGLDPGLATAPSWVILVKSLESAPLPSGRRGLRLSVARQLHRNPMQALDPAWKTGNYLNNLLCLHEARKRGADEVVILNTAGSVAEAAVCNIAFVADGIVHTPATACGILHGITRGLLVERIARDAGFAVVEREIRPEEFARFDECFLTSTTRDIAEVEAIDETVFRLGRDTAAARLKTAFAAYAARYAEERVHYRL